jgi:hypothetical protein
MRWRRLLLCLLFALTFDAVVPFEPTAAGRLQLDDDLEEAAQLRARRDHRRDVSNVTRRTAPAALRVVATPRLDAPVPHLTRPQRTESLVPPPRVATDPPGAPPAPGEDH